ncbi:hypothetical protein ACRCUN_04530 [Mycobacterium sp. LTG2003]
MSEDEPISDAELSAMLDRADSASKAPWEAFIEGPGDSFSSFIRVGGFDDDEEDMYVSRDKAAASDADLNFIAAARQDVPRLVAEIRRLRHELAQATGGA